MGKASRRKSQSLLHGALVLTTSVLTIKLVDTLFKMPLIWAIIEDGLGYFNTAYNFYGLIYSLVTVRSLIAISRLASESCTRDTYRNIQRIHHVSASILIDTGTVGFALMVFDVAAYTKIIDSENAPPVLYTLAPVILLSCLTAIYRGYYEGLRSVYSTAISEIIEALSKLTVGLSAACLTLHQGMKKYETLGMAFGVVAASHDYARSAALPYVAAGAILDVTVGSFLSPLFLFCRHKLIGDGTTEEDLRSPSSPCSIRKTASCLVRTAIPTGIGAMAVSVTAMVDTTFLQTQIHNIVEQNPQVLLFMYQGMIPQINIETDTVPNFLFGCFSIALTLFVLVPAITQALGISVLPNVAAAYIHGEALHSKRSIEAVLRATILSNIPTDTGLVAVAGPVARPVFGTRPLLPTTSHVLVIMRAGAIFAPFSTPVNNMLQAVGRVGLPIKLLAARLTTRVTLNYLLVEISEINVLGVGVGALVCYFFLTVAALVCLCREIRIMQSSLSIFGKPPITSILCRAAAWSTRGLLPRVLSENLLTLGRVDAAVLVYPFSSPYLRATCRDDILMLPNGQKIAKTLEKYGRIR